MQNICLSPQCIFRQFTLVPERRLIFKISKVGKAYSIEALFALKVCAVNDIDYAHVVAAIGFCHAREGFFSQNVAEIFFRIFCIVTWAGVKER